jgi:hypothetical protein
MVHISLHLFLHFSVVSGTQTVSYALDRASSMKRVPGESDCERVSRSPNERKAAMGTGFSQEVMATLARCALETSGAGALR